MKDKIAKNKRKYLPMDPDSIEDFMDEYEHKKWELFEESEKRR